MSEGQSAASPGPCTPSCCSETGGLSCPLASPGGAGLFTHMPRRQLSSPSNNLPIMCLCRPWIQRQVPPDSPEVLPREAKMVLDEEALNSHSLWSAFFQEKEICSWLVGYLTSGKALAHLAPSVPSDLADIIISSGFYLWFPFLAC